NGCEVCRAIRRCSNVPILMLTARDTEQDEMEGFHCGADEYISKPFSPAILMTRVKNLLRRTGMADMEDLEMGSIRVLQRERTVLVAGRRVIMTPKEFDLLCYLLRNRGLVLSREQIIDRIWGMDYDGDDRTVDTHIKCLRAKLGDAGAIITTIRKVGYKLECLA
ncbi:MAG: response regulator transcription factor, partial [Angelakisella sp.]